MSRLPQTLDVMIETTPALTGTAPVESIPAVEARFVSGQEPHGRAPRLASLDVLRGLTVAFMILVNNAGDGSASYAQLRHSAWNGCTLTDVVFPLFLFIMGVSMALSFQSRLARGTTRTKIAGQVLKRATTILLLGLAINALPLFHLATLRYCGVLQRIGLCYLLCALILLYARVPGVVLALVASLAGYWWLMTRVSVPGFGQPGINFGLLDPSANLASYIDRLLIPQAHRYHFSFYDPEGVLSTIPAVANTLFGVLTAVWLRRMRVPTLRSLLTLAVPALMMIVLGLIWSQSFPLNKRLWTSSYVLFTSGISVGLLCLVSWIVDVQGWLRRGLTPWLVFGMNALTAYIFSEVFGILLGFIPLQDYGTLQRFLFLLLPTWLGPAPFRSLIWSILFVGVCYVPVWWLYRRRIFLKL